MFKGFSIKDLIKGDSVAGVEVEMLQDGFRWSYAILKKKKGKLNIISSGFELNDLEEIKSCINAHLPICLSITGKGVITKKVALSENENENSLLHKALPNANPEDFYLQKTEIENNHALVSIVRMAVLDEILSQFKNIGYFVVGISFGPLALTEIVSLISLSDPESSKFNGHNLLMNKGEIHDYFFEKKNESVRVDIAGESIDERCAIAFVSAFSYFVAQNEISNVPEVKRQQNEYKHKRMFHIAGWAILIFFFTTLLVNFFMYSHFNNQAAKLKLKVDKNKDDLASIATLQNDLLLKQKLLDRLGLLESSKISFFSDRISSDLPKEIHLSEMFIHPVEKNINAGKKEFNFLTKTINISGECKKSTDLNEWVKLLMEKDWIKTVTVVNYSQENSSESGIFQLQIGIKEH